MQKIEEKHSFGTIAEVIPEEYAELNIGQRFGSYEIVSHLGKGGMGEVYLAQDHRLSRKVALKLLPANLIRDSDRVRRFRQEARAASALSHPNVATIYEIGETDGLYFIAMEYVDGQTLDLKMKGRVLDAGEIIEIGLQMADALQEAHAKGIIHRDIKPGNIMLTPRGQVKMLDFGLAKIIRSEQDLQSELSLAKTTPGLLMGTVKYMSPEQALGRIVDHRTDLFSIGVVLYEMVAGCPPFSGDSATETIDQILHAEPEPIARYHPNVPTSLEQIISNCLEKDREQRYQNARELLEDLKSLKYDSKWGAVARRSAVMKSIAVLPFKPLTAESRDEALELGMADTLIIRLSNIQQMLVSPTSAVRKYGSLEQDPVAAGRELRVDSVLEGNLQRHGDRLRVSVRLLSVRDGVTLWAGTFNENFTDIFSVQDSISERMATALALKLTDPQKQQLTKHFTQNIQAYELYLKGRYHFGRITEQEIKTAIDYFKQAIQLDPHYALAYASLADAYQMLAYFNYLSPKETMSQSKEAAIKALELDETLADAYAVLAFNSLSFDWNWKEAEKGFKRTLELNPNFGHAHHQYSHYLTAMGRTEESLAESLRALELERLGLEMNTHLVWHYYYARQYDEAITHCMKTLEIEPNFWFTRLLLAQNYTQKKMYQEAIIETQKSIDLSARMPDRLATLGHAYAVSGRGEEAEKIINELNELSKKRYISPYFTAVIYAGLGKKDQALEWLEKAYEDRSEPLVYLKSEPLFDLLRENPQFSDLMRRIGLQ
jgi:serine/threonine protein kinase/Tfp pilus assembly protein PilF